MSAAIQRMHFAYLKLSQDLQYNFIAEVIRDKVMAKPKLLIHIVKCNLLCFIQAFKYEVQQGSGGMWGCKILQLAVSPGESMILIQKKLLLLSECWHNCQGLCTGLECPTSQMMLLTASGGKSVSFCTLQEYISFVSCLEITEFSLFKLFINPLKKGTKNYLGLYVPVKNSDSFYIIMPIFESFSFIYRYLLNTSYVQGLYQTLGI